MNVADWLVERNHQINFDALDFTYPHTIYVGRGDEAIMVAGVDEISGGGGDDFVLSDSVSVATSVQHPEPTTRFLERDPEFKVGFLDRQLYELTNHYQRFGASQIGTDTIQGDAGNDTLFGQTQNDALFGNDGDDGIFGGSGVNTGDGGAGVNDVRLGSDDRPKSVQLDELETYHFDLNSHFISNLLDDVGNDAQISADDLFFELEVGNFIVD